MDNVHEIGLLLDFYGQLLTERQFDILDLHYNNDYSLGEIAEHFGISRQGVYDNIKKGKKALYGFENKLKLVGKFAEQKTRAEKILAAINHIRKGALCAEGQRYLELAEKEIAELMNNF